MVMAAGSLNCGCAGGAALAAAPDPAGEGVGGTALAAPALVATGAGGGAGVAVVVGCAGVDGIFDAAAAGAAFGLETMQTMNPFSSIL